MPCLKALASLIGASRSHRLRVLLQRPLLQRRTFFNDCWLLLLLSPQEVRDQILKRASINLCPNVSGQICTSLMMNPPQPGDPSYPLYEKERTQVRPPAVSLHVLQAVFCW